MWKAIVNAWNGVEEPTNADSRSKRAPVTTLKFQQVVQEVKNNDPNTVIVDVREPSEYEVVSIPGSINVPYRSHPNGFALDDAQFKQTFNVNKPSKGKRLIFLCASGKRASGAEEVASNDGYLNTAVYTGSMNDWVENGGDKLKF
ncbi:thiosulfate:glutathione sulfurtransferase [Monosporozyma servazzii]